MRYTYDDAVRELKTLIAFDDEPSLTEGQLDDLLSNAARADFSGNGPTNQAALVDAYATATAYTVGNIVEQNGNFWIATTAGTSTGITFALMRGMQVQTDTYLEIDGDILWEWLGTEWSPTYDLNAAACAGWRVKAGKVSHKYSFSTDGQTFTRAQWFQACLSMASQYEKKTAYTVRCDLPGAA